MSIINTEGVSKTYRLGKTLVQALNNVSVSFEKGDFACVMGPSGAGKSTLLHLMGGLDKPTAGRVLVNGTHLGVLNDDKLSEFRNRTLGFIFQSFNLIPVLSVYENIEYPLIVGKQPHNRSKILELIERVGLKEQIQHKPDELSGGQRQRVAIARALVTEPNIVMADEPTANLDSKTGEMIVELMLELNREKNTTFIFSTHNPMVANHAKKIIHLLDGRIAEDTNVVH